MVSGRVRAARPALPPSRLLAAGLLVVMGLMWGLQLAMLKLAARGGYSEIAVVMIALVLLSLAFLGIAWLRNELRRPGPGTLRFFLITSALGYVVPLIAALSAAAQLSTGLLSMIGSTSPVVAITIALAMRTEPVSRRRIGAVVLGLLSVAVILVPQLEGPGHGMAPWILVALMVPVAYGVESVYIARHWPEDMTPLQAVTGETVVAAFLVLPLFALTRGDLPFLTGWSLAETAILIFVAAGVIESLIYFFLIRHTGGVFVNFGTFVSLFAGIGWGVLLFSETHSALVWGAVLLLVGSLWLVGRER